MVEDYSGDRDIFGDENAKIFEICVNNIGSMEINEQSIDQADEIHFDLSSIKTESAMEHFLSQFSDHHNSNSSSSRIITKIQQKTTEIDLMAKGSDFDCRPEFVAMRKKASSSSSSLLMTFCYNNQLFSRLIVLNLRYVNFTNSDFQLLCDILNPLKGRSSIRKLSLYRCELDDERTIKLFKDICGNILLTYIDLTSNRIGNEGIKAIADSLSYHEAQTKYLALGNNNFSDEGLNQLTRLFSQHRSHLTYLQIPNNHQITSLYLDQTFSQIVYIGLLKQLTLSGCNIIDCNWSRYLPFLRSLQILNLSYNSIDDRNIFKLLLSLQLCFSLIEVDISFNKFRSYPHIQYVLRDLLIINESLQHLHLNGNRFQALLPIEKMKEREREKERLKGNTNTANSASGMTSRTTTATSSKRKGKKENDNGTETSNSNNNVISGTHSKREIDHLLSAPTIWSLLGEGIAKNQTLLSLSLQDCGIKQENLLEFLPALQVNDRITLRLENNSLPMEAIKNVRRYYEREWKLLPLSKHRELQTLSRVGLWRREQRRILEKELESLAVVVDEKNKQNNKGTMSGGQGSAIVHGEEDEMQQILRERDEQQQKLLQQDSHFKGGEIEEKEELDDVSPLSSSMMAGMKLSDSQHKPTHPSLDTTLVSTQAITNLVTFQRMIWSQEVIERSSRYRTIEELNRLVTDIETMNTVEGKYIDIAFGREAFILGNVEIFSHTTYGALREMVKPLVKEHAATVDGERLDEFLNFKLSDPTGKVVDVDAELKTRLVWSEVFNQEHPVIVLRPATWISL